MRVKTTRYLATIPREDHFGSGHNSHKHQRGQQWEPSRHNAQPYFSNKCLRLTHPPKQQRRTPRPGPQLQAGTAQQTGQAGRPSAGASILRATTAATARRAATSRSPRAWPASTRVSSA